MDGFTIAKTALHWKEMGIKLSGSGNGNGNESLKTGGSRIAKDIPAYL